MIKSERLERFRRHSLVVCILALANACSSASKQNLDAPKPPTPPPVVMQTVTVNPTECIATGSLHDLWIKRMNQGEGHDYPIGPGDVLEISVTDVDELKLIEARVSGEGTIDLPLIGELSVLGMREDDVRQSIAKKLQGFVLEPRVHVFVREYRSHSVTVMGMVAKPGAYPLASSGDSILDMIGLAGGIRPDAAQRVMLFPSRTPGDNFAQSHSARAISSCGEVVSNHQMNGDSVRSVEPCKAEELPARKLADVSGPNGSRNLRVDPIIIELDERDASACLNIPARPDDEVVVPPAGQVGVYGWVVRPGSFEITPGMTVLGAVSAAGGALYSSNADILRKDASGQRSDVPMDLSKLEDGRSPDIPVQAGDLIVVRSSALGFVPYTLTQILHLGTGAGVGIGVP